MTTATLIRQDVSNQKHRLWLPTVAFVLTLAYMELGHLSPAALFPQLAEYRIMIWLSVLATLACLPRLFQRTTWSTPQLYLMLGLMAAVLISRIEPSSGGAVQGLRAFLVPSVVFFFVIASVNTIGRMRILTSTVVLSALYLLSQSCLGWLIHGMNSPYVFRQKLYDSYENAIGEFPRLQAVGFLQNPNDFAQYLLVAASLLMFTWKPGRRRRNVLLVWLPMAYLMWGVWATHSRGGLIGISVVVFFLLEKRIGRISSLLVAGTLLGLLFLANGAGPRLTSLHDPSVAGRIDAWKGGIQMLTTSPLFGVGFKLFQSKYPALTAHNSFVLCFAELGMLGYLFWLGLIVFSVTDLNRILRNENTPGCTPDAVRCAGAIRTALFSFLITAWFLSRTYTMTFYLLLGMAAAMRQLLLHRKTEPLIDLPRWALTFTCAAVSIVAVCATIWLKSL